MENTWVVIHVSPITKKKSLNTKKKKYEIRPPNIKSITVEIRGTSSLVVMPKFRGYPSVYF